MDKLLEHIRRTAESQLDRAKWRLYVQSFLSDVPREWQETRFRLSHSQNSILEVLGRYLSYNGFDCGRGIDYERGQIQAKLQHRYGRNEDWFATVEGLFSEWLDLTFEVLATVTEDSEVTLRLSHYLPTWADELKTTLAAELAKRAVTRLRPFEKNRVLGPGEELKTAFWGRFRDYSGCATLAEVRDLVKRPGDDKTLPLGEYAFDDQSIGQPPMLYLSRYRTGKPMEYNGTLVVAPQNSGKTELIVRWARAANRRGYSVFLVDVKGNLYKKLRPYNLKGKLCHFSTSPSVKLGQDDCGRINFLAGPPWCPVLQDWLTPLESERIREFVGALLPDRGWTEQGGENEFHYLNRVVWLTAFIHILKLYYFYFAHGGDFTDAAGQHRTPDLSDLYRLVLDENVLYAILGQVGNEQGKRRQAGEALPEELTAEYWAQRIALLLSPDAMRNVLPAVTGQRRAEFNYNDYTQGMVLALESFATGTLRDKVRDVGAGSSFALEDLGKEQVTIIFAAREQDAERSKAAVSMAIKKLQHYLFDRFDKDESELRPMLLLLDETRRIRGFDVGDYVTFAREAKAGCVLVYQSLDQIGEREKINTLLENIGTQIYLGSLVGNTARYFIESLPQRSRPTFSRTASFGSDGKSESEQVGQEKVDYFTTYELYRLPAGEWPALVYINDQPRRSPFLVDMSNAFFEQTLSESPQQK